MSGLDWTKSTAAVAWRPRGEGMEWEREREEREGLPVVTRRLDSQRPATKVTSYDSTLVQEKLSGTRWSVRIGPPC